MYCQLGAIIFEPLPVETLGEKYSYNYAEHQVIEGKPLLQFIGANLDETTLGVRLHVSFCDPPTAFARLKAEADRHEALRLILGDGTLLGRRVVCDIEKTLIQTADNGRPMLIEARLTLKEWVDTDPMGSKQAAQVQAAPGLTGAGPIGKVTPQDRGQIVICAGLAKANAKEIAKEAGKIEVQADKLKAQFSGLTAVADQIKATAARARAAVAPVMAQAQNLAAGVQGAAAELQSQAQGIASISSDLTRILSGLPGPAGQLGRQMAAANRRISAKATDTITLSQLTQGGAAEAGTRARMITRLLPAPPARTA